MLTKVILEGEFAKVVKQKEWMLDCSSPAEAIQLISANTGGAIKKWIRQHLNDYKICEVECVDEYNHSEKLTTETFMTERKCKVIRFLPIFTGAGGGNGVFQTIIGVVLIVVGAICCYIAPPAGGALMKVGMCLVSAGIGLALSGICTMLMSQTTDKEDDSTSNYYFNGAQNTTNQGAPVPLVFGRCRVGSAVISSGIDIS